jgi:hypothetical protein
VFVREHQFGGRGDGSRVIAVHRRHLVGPLPAIVTSVILETARRRPAPSVDGAPPKTSYWSMSRRSLRGEKMALKQR